MARGGFRPGAGRPKKSLADVPPRLAPPPPPGGIKEAVQESVVAAVEGATSPLEYMLAVMNDPAVDAVRRDRMAIAAAPFVHGRLGENAVGKREEDADAARRGATGKYAPPPPPARLVVNNE